MKLKFGVLIIGAVVVLFIGLRFFLSKSKNNNFNNLTFENSGVNLENKENQRIVRGEVTSWDWKKGRLMLWSGNKNLEIMVEPAKMMVFTANPTKNTEMLPIFEKNGWLWETAFCPKDQVVATYQEERLLMVDNGGPRRCGYKGE